MNHSKRPSTPDCRHDDAVPLTACPASAPPQRSRQPISLNTRRPDVAWAAGFSTGRLHHRNVASAWAVEPTWMVKVADDTTRSAIRHGYRGKHERQAALTTSP